MVSWFLGLIKKKPRAPPPKTPKKDLPRCPATNQKKLIFREGSTSAYILWWSEIASLKLQTNALIGGGWPESIPAGQLRFCFPLLLPAVPRLSWTSHSLQREFTGCVVEPGMNPAESIWPPIFLGGEWLSLH